MMAPTTGGWLQGATGLLGLGHDSKQSLSLSLPQPHSLSLSPSLCGHRTAEPGGESPEPMPAVAPAAAVLPAQLTSLGHLLGRTGLSSSLSPRTVTTKHGCLSLVWGGLQPSEADWSCPSPPSPSRLQRQLRGTPVPFQSLVASAPALSLQLWSVSPDHQATAPPAPCCPAANRVLAHR